MLAIALGVAFGAATLFDVSFALGAFFAGMILSESELSQRAAEETLPLRDAFAVLFFVSVGMLFDPTILVERAAGRCWRRCSIIVVGKSVAAFVIVRAFGYPNATALTISASLAQIGEFSFILAGLGVALGLLPERGRDLILAGAHPVDPAQPGPVRRCSTGSWRKSRAARSKPPRRPRQRTEAAAARNRCRSTPLTDHVVLVGYGRVGSVVGDALRRSRRAVSRDRERRRTSSSGCGSEGIEAHRRQRRRSGIMRGRQSAGRALPAGRDSGCVRGRPGGRAGAARSIPGCRSSRARIPSEEIEHLKRHGATKVIMGEHEIAKAMIAGVPA